MMPRSTAQSQQSEVAVRLPPFPIDKVPAPRNIVAPPPPPTTGKPLQGLPNIDEVRNAPRVVPPAPPRTPSQFPPCSPYEGPCSRVTHPQPLPLPTPLPTPIPAPTLRTSANAGGEPRMLLAAYRAAPVEDSVSSGDAGPKSPIGLPPRTRKRSAGSVALMQAQGDFATPRTDPRHETGQPGVDLGSGNFNWSTPLVHLPGRAGLDVNLGLSYNSLVWTKDRANTAIQYNADHGFPVPGFRLGLPIIQPLYYNEQAGRWSMLLITPSGAHVELRNDLPHPTTTGYFRSVDNTNTELHVVNNMAYLRMADGTHYNFTTAPYSEWRCTSISDRNGNYITITYDGGSNRPATIVDTVGRTLYFDYDGNQNLSRIKQWQYDDGSWQVREWATFSYENLTVQPNFGNLTVIGAGATISVPTRVTLLDGSYYEFEYTIWGQVREVRRYGADGTHHASISYNLPTAGGTAYTECPSFTERSEWIKHGGLDGQNGTLVTNYGFDRNRTGDDHAPAWGYLIEPGGRTLYAETFATGGWQKGLTTYAETFAAQGGAWIRKKQTRVYWEQNNGTLDDAVNPRPKEVRVHDMEDESVLRYSGTIYDYKDNSYGLVEQVQEYYDNPNIQANILRTTIIDYNLSGAYLNNRRIIGLVSEERVYDGPEETSSKLIAKTSYEYDRSGSQFLKHEGDPLNHVASFNTGYIPRGNLCAVKRWNVTGGGSLESERGYNTSGVLIRTKDAAGHQSTISYTDNYAAGAPHGNTMAYPTRVTDGDGYVSRVQYDFDNGLVTQTRTPQPTQGANSEPQGATTTMSYDSAGRIKRVTQANGGYTRYEYPPHPGYIQRYTTLEDGQGEDYYIEFFDGAGRVRANGGYLDGSVGTWRGQLIFYNEVGRRAWLSNMTEINNDWVPTGDAAAGGWRWDGWEYDWQGRVTKEINADNTERTTSYGGCGCVGGQTATTTDEVGRKREQVYNKLGLVYQTKVLNPGGSVYSTTTNTYNGRDQVTEVKEQAGASGTAQFTTFGYDGYGRLVSRQAPQETSATTYSYHADDMVQTITDARGATQTFGYNGRHLPEAITYGAHGGAAATANVSILYDALGNRDYMDDGPGVVDYVYDSMSRLEIESRWFDDLGRSYDINYTYNIGGQLKSITDPFGNKVEYERDRMGRVTDATGTGYADIIVGSTNRPVTQFASNMEYRAWGAPKHMTNGDSSDKAEFNLSYNARQQLTRFEAAGRATEHEYYADGLIRYVRDLHYQNFNRNFSYDHVGRLTSASAGESPHWLVNPYSFTYAYDVWDHTTGRNGNHWSSLPPNYDATYVNNRNQAWQYDAAGNPTRTDQLSDASNQYDAAGRLAVVRDLPGGWLAYLRTTNRFDGDGLMVQRNLRMDGESADIQRNFFVPSTVLGGKIVAEVRNQGTQEEIKDRSYVYVNNERIAYQKYRHPDGPEKEVVWVYHNPVTNTHYEHNRLMFYGTETDFVHDETVVDALNGAAGLTDPYQQPPAPEPAPQRYDPYSDIYYFDNGCYMDGLPTPCGFALSALNSGAATVGSLTQGGGFGRQLVPIMTGIERVANPGWTPARGEVYRIPRYTEQVSYRYMFMPETRATTDSEADPATPQQPVPTPGPAPERPGEKLSDCVKQILSNYLSPKVLDSIRIHSGLPTIVGMTEYVSGPKGAVTWGSDVYFGEGQYDPYSAIGISNIGHEGAHVEQFARLGKSKFSIQYADSYKNNILGGMSGKDAYLKNRLEVDPYALGERIRMDLQAVYKGKDPCKP